MTKALISPLMLAGSTACDRNLATDILYELGGGVVHALPYRAGAYNERTPLMHEIRTDGVDL